MVCLTIVVGILILLLPVSGYSWGRPSGLNLVTIEKPEQRQTLYADPVEIFVRFENGTKPESFRAWLNFKNITDKFKAAENGMRALVGPEDGLKVYAERLKTTRDDKGVWFIKGSSKPGCKFHQGRNFLKTTIKGKKGRRDVDYKFFSVDVRLYDATEAMGHAVATDRLWQTETYRRQARGRLAEILGPDLLGTDIYFRTLGYSDQELQDGFNALDSETQAVINGYMAGFNRRIAEVRNDTALLPFEFKALNVQPADWTVLDLLAWASLLQRSFDSEALDTTQVDNAALYQGLMNNFSADAQGMFDDLRWVNDPEALTYIPPAETSSVSAMAPQPMALTMGAARAAPMAAGTGHHLAAGLSQAAETMSANRENVVQRLKEINAYVKLGSYAWTISGDKTESGNPTIYSGPQMGFPVPSIVLEGSVRAAGLDVSGMNVAGVPFVNIIGRTPHHSWSMQVGCNHTVDYYIEDPAAVNLHRLETIKVAGSADVTLPVYRSVHGPIINPMPYIPESHNPAEDGPIIAWKYSQWGYEFDYVKGSLGLARAKSMDEFGEAIELVNFTIHYCYADRDGNIAYWMAGRDPLRPEGEWRLPQGLLGAPLEWDASVLIPRSTDRNTSQGFYGGWNNKSRPDFNSGQNATWLILGPFHRAHVIDDYLSSHNNLTFEEIRDLALNIATTNSWSGGGIPWKFVAEDFSAAVNSYPTEKRLAALALLADWDGHWVAGGPSQWAWGRDVADGWILMEAWISEVIGLTFDDELATLSQPTQPTQLLFNVLLHGLAGSTSGIVNNYDWFQNLADSTAPQTPDEIIVQALDTVLAELDVDDRPWGTEERGEIEYVHDILGPVHATPLSQRSTYAHCVEVGPRGPVRIESMFPLGESGTILWDGVNDPVFDQHFFSMTPEFDAFAPRDFPVFGKCGKR